MASGVAYIYGALWLLLLLCTHRGVIGVTHALAYILAHLLFVTWPSEVMVTYRLFWTSWSLRLRAATVVLRHLNVSTLLILTLLMFLVLILDLTLIFVQNLSPLGSLYVRLHKKVLISPNFPQTLILWAWQGRSQNKIAIQPDIPAGISLVSMTCACHAPRTFLCI